MSNLMSSVTSATNVNVSTGVFGLGAGLTGPGVDSPCRYRGVWYPMDSYRLITCAYCYLFVYQKTWEVSPTFPHEIETGPDSAYGPGELLAADLNNETSAHFVCSSLQPPHECWTWKSCCKEAEACCQRQKEEGPGPHEEHGKTVCPRTWDGFSCWSDTTAGLTKNLECPAYVPGVASGSHVIKTCTGNATWLQQFGFEWTDYTTCGKFQQYNKVYTAALTCNIITLILVLPACFIFLYFRQLRHQHRIRLHVCLMVSSFLTSVSMITWDLVIANDRMRAVIKSETVMHQNSVGCRILQLITRYTYMASFMWMFIEGFHLHRLLVHAFSVPKSLLPYYVLGFGVPVVPITVYAALRATDSTLNRDCWAPNAEYFEWLLFSPILLSLLVNVFFMIRIVYIMVNQLEPHPNEPSTFRRAVKAVGVLVPLFGIQFLLFVYRPGEPQSNLSLGFEITNKVFSSLQGAFISIIFCYMNKEVRGYLKVAFVSLLGRAGLSHDFVTRGTLTTQYPSEVTRTRSVCDAADAAQMIPLKPIYTGSEATTAKGGNSHSTTNGDAHHVVGGDELEDDRLLTSSVTVT